MFPYWPPHPDNDQLGFTFQRDVSKEHMAVLMGVHCGSSHTGGIVGI